MNSDGLDGLENSHADDAANVQNAASSFVWTPQTITLSVILFVAAGLLEVGGGWLV